VEIGIIVELCPIDEDRDDDLIALGGCRAHQTGVTVMQGTHGRDQTDPVPVPASAAHGRTQLGHLTTDDHGTSSLDAGSNVAQMFRAEPRFPAPEQWNGSINKRN